MFLAAIGDTPVDDQKAEKLTKPLKDIGHDHVYHIWASEEGTGHKLHGAKYKRRSILH